jgi:acetyltransferase-like isoleucine patch superfamily enzyme
MKKNIKMGELCKKNADKIKHDSTGSELFIWGAGEFGKFAARYFQDQGLKINGFIDSNKVGMVIDGLTVYAKEDIFPENSYIVIAIITFESEIIEFLLKKNFRKKQICYLYDSLPYNKEDIIYKGCKVGRYTYGYKELLEYYPMAISIGRYCSINGTARIWNNHPIHYVTTSPILDHVLFYDYDKYKIRQSLLQKYGKYEYNHSYENSPIRKNKPIMIGNDVWIGANVCILPGVTIGDGAVIAAGAIVNKDVPPYAIVGGVPAKIIRYRFSRDICEKLLKIKWWDWEHKDIEDNIELLFNPEFMCKKFE